jgi:hypothetical protein
MPTTGEQEAMWFSFVVASCFFWLPACLNPFLSLFAARAAAERASLVQAPLVRMLLLVAIHSRLAGW